MERCDERGERGEQMDHVQRGLLLEGFDEARGVARERKKDGEEEGEKKDQITDQISRALVLSLMDDDEDVEREGFPMEMCEEEEEEETEESSEGIETFGQTFVRP